MQRMEVSVDIDVSNGTSNVFEITASTGATTIVGPTIINNTLIIADITFG